MNKPVIVTGCGRSGTHWLGHILCEVFGRDAAFEPFDYLTPKTVVVDSRLRNKVPMLDAKGHKIVHLVRDGRDVVRSLDQWYRSNTVGGRYYNDGSFKTTHEIGEVPFDELCHEWRNSVDILADFKTLRIEDLTPHRAKQSTRHLPHWTEWDEAMTEAFWDICGSRMRLMGYDR